MYGALFFIPSANPVSDIAEADAEGYYYVVYPYEDVVQMINNRPGITSEYRNNFSFPATDVMSAIVELHHDIMFFLIVIIILVSWMLFNSVFLYSESQGTNRVPSNINHDTFLEIV